VELTSTCSDYEEGTKLLVGGHSYDGKVFLADIRKSSLVSCERDKLRTVPRSNCPASDTPAIASNIFILVVVIEVAILCFWCCTGSPKMCLFAYWWNDFFAGLLSASLATEIIGTNGQWMVSAVACGLFAAQIFEFLLYDGPLRLVRCCSAHCFVLAAVVLGASCAGYGIILAYDPVEVAILGHHVLLMGAFNFALDFVKHAATHNAKRFLCGQHELEVYKPILSELTDVLTEEIKAQILKDYKPLLEAEAEPLGT